MCKKEGGGMEYSIGILAGGLSTRMGSDKSKLLWQGRTFLQILLNEFSDITDCMVSVGRDQDFELIPCRKVIDTIHNIGPIEGIRELLIHAKNPYVFICATDMPFLKRELPTYLLSYINDDYDSWVIKNENGLHPLCGIYSVRILPVIEELIHEKDYKLQHLLNRIRTKFITLDTLGLPDIILSNINTKEEYNKLLHIKNISTK